MPNRLQVIVKDSEYREIRRTARARQMSVVEWVRQALRQAYREEPLGEVRKKLAVIRSAARLDYPTADIHRMLAEIQAGRGSTARR